jgi:hypothetical protein
MAPIMRRCYPTSLRTATPYATEIKRGQSFGEGQPFTPSVYGHAGPVPAFLIVASREFDWWWRFGLLPILVVWAVASLLLLSIARQRERKQ